MPSSASRIAPPAPSIDPRSLKPNIRLFGKVDDMMLAKVLDNLDALAPGDPAVLELTTEGGDADIGRRIALEFRLAADGGRKTYFIGKTSVMSAGITIMSSFAPAHRFLDRNCELMIHERRLEKTVQLSGPVRSSIPMARDLLAELESGLRLEQQDFRALIAGTRVSFAELDEKVSKSNWYVPAEEALALGLVAGIF